MSIIQLKCKNCGGDIEFDDSNNYGICQYCGTTFKKEEAQTVNNYYNNVSNTTVIYNDETSIEAKLKNAETFLTTVNQKDEAMEIYEYVTKNKPDDYRGWWGLVRVLSEDFSYTALSENEFSVLEKYAGTALKVADESQKNEIAPVWEEYSGKVKQYIEKTVLEKKHKRHMRLIRKLVGIVLSFGCNITVLLWYFNTDISKLNPNENISLLIFIAVILSNSILSTVLGLISSSNICCLFPVAVTTVTVTLTAIDIFPDVNFFASPIEFIIGLALTAVPAVAVFAVCAGIPLLPLLRKIAKSSYDDSEEAS